MSDLTAFLGLPLMAPAQAQKHVTYNEALALLDALAQLVVQDRSLSVPPGNVTEGQVYIVAGSGGGDWAGQGGRLAIAASGGGWRFVEPRPGWHALDLGTGGLIRFDGTTWVAPDWGVQATLGINTAADETNRLAVAAPAVLLTHAGDDHRVILNKATEPDTTSFLFQTNYSGRAEVGLAGSDALSVKVSPDGTTWTEALRLDPATGAASGAAVQQSATDATPGRLMRADFGYGPATVLGTVSEVAGAPTGALIEHGGTASGDYVRFADGTQICSHTILLGYHSASRLSAGWTFPAAFHSNPSGIFGTVNSNSAANRATPSPDELGSLQHSNLTESETTLNLYRIPNTTDFQPGDEVSVRATAIGRWYE